MACQDQYQIEVQPSQASGVNSTAISSPHIIQYPKQPKRDDGKWMALGSIIGALIGKFANAGKMREASRTEDTWRDLNDRIRDQGQAEWDRAPGERHKADMADDDLGSRAEKESQRADVEYDYSEFLKACVDNLTAKACAIADCGYQPDYIGILRRAKADAEIIAQAKIDEACRSASRYNVGLRAVAQSDIRRATAMSIVGIAARQREEERATMWKINSELTTSTLNLIEGMRVRRQEVSGSYATRHASIQDRRFQVRNSNGYESIRLGGDLLASAGQNYAWLAESLRRSAEKDAGNFSSLGALIATLFLPQFFKDCSYETKDCSCEEPSD